MRFHRKTVVSLALALLTLAAARAHAQSEGVAGRWLLDEAASTSMKQIVDAGMSKLGRVYRVWPISTQAKKRLQDTNRRYTWILITRQPGDSVEVRTDTYTLTTPSNGVRKDWEREKGDFIDVTTRWEGNRLEQTFDASDGRRVNVYTVAPDGTLHLDVTVTSPKLDSPLTYRMVYHR
ncbi:MAG TPA: hypothetical protein VFL93_11655 [Longimicrobiaceae bacterium]|jgi:hypothetical protein|nr:hypothetical protein [Longimicrobiaceae bacterium]